MGSDSGTWSVNGSQLCIKWRTWDDGRNVCYVVSGSGSSYTASGDGLLNGRFTLKK